MAKEIYIKQKVSKKLGQVDTRYLKIVERLVCEEFAVALNTHPDSIKKRLYSAMDQQTTIQ